VLVLNRSRGRAAATLKVTGRGIEAADGGGRRVSSPAVSRVSTCLSPIPMVGYLAWSMASSDPLREVREFDAKRDALRDAVAPRAERTRRKKRVFRRNKRQPL
jgi:hypothetical protein